MIETENSDNFCSKFSYYRKLVKATIKSDRPDFSDHVPVMLKPRDLMLVDQQCPQVILDNLHETLPCALHLFSAQQTPVYHTCQLLK
jgi:hypothetical protein